MRKLTEIFLIVILFMNISCSAQEESKMNSTTETEHKYTNHLIDENSPYLLSHAHNPVDWYPWGEEAIARARELNRPIFLSIGYAACHWCHVMERESFENETIAALMNKDYICIKVDREQRPDIDEIYMAFTTIMTGSGGWPMSVFLTPDLKPFYAGTYFPPEDKYGRPGFSKILTEIARAYKEDHEKIVSSSAEIFAEVSRRIQSTTTEQAIAPNAVALGAGQLMRNFDQANGGFGSSPKFPHALELSLFMRHYKNSGDKSYLAAAQKAIDAMADGGIFDHVGGGFARYSTDERWLVPHFEKMLYDNSLLVQTYADAYQITGNEAYKDIIRRTLDFMLREMLDESGGFYSALDADSEGEEGKFYVWSRSEIISPLGDDAGEFIKYYNVTMVGNFEGHNILNITNQSKKVRHDSKRPDFDSYLESCRERLLVERAKRIRPLTDDKILSSWNGLALSALCRGYEITNDEKYLKVARANAEFISKKLFVDGRLTHSYREGRHSDGEFLEDYSFYLNGLINLYQIDIANDNYRWIALATQFADRALELFLDQSGELYLREAGLADLIIRPREISDGAIPSPGNMLIWGLVRLGRLTGEQKYDKASENALRAVSGMINRSPSSMASALFAVDYNFGDKLEAVIVGDGTNRSLMIKSIRSKYFPNLLLAVSNDGKSKLPVFEGRTSSDGNATAFLCRNSVCSLPVSTMAEFETQLQSLQ